MPISARMLARNMYVGAAKMEPLSRIPRRLIAITSRMKKTISGTATRRSGGNGE